MQDIEYLKSMYPAGIKMLQEYVSEACDRLDYDNSPMYDEFPDHMMVNRLCDTICDTVVSSEGIERIRSMWNIRETDQRAMEAEEISKNLEQLEDDESAEKKNPLMDDLALEPLETQELRFQEMQAMEWDGRPPMNPGSGRPPMNPGPGRPPRPVPPPPGSRPPWLRDIIKVLLLNEMFNRRCARGFCR